MKINGINIETYGARLQDYVCGASELSSQYYTSVKSLYPVFLSAEKGLRSLSITLEFQGHTWQETALSISNLTAELTGAQVDLQMEDGFGYFAILQSVSQPELVLPEKQFVTFQFAALRHGEKVVEAFTQSGQIEVAGNLPADCIVQVTADEAQDYIQVLGIRIDHMTAGKSVVIDGIAKTVTQENKNKLGDTDLTEFPKLTPGQVVVEVPAGVSMKIEYYPLYL